MGGTHIVVDSSGHNTNPEEFLQIFHWQANEVTVAVAGVGGQQSLGAAVGAGLTRRIRELHIRHAGSENTVVALVIVGGAIVRSWDIPAQTTRVVSSVDGWAFVAGQTPAVRTSSIAGGSTFVGAEGLEAPPA